MRGVTINRARTWHYRRMRRCVESSNGLGSLSPFPSWLGCIINTSGYDFGKDNGEAWFQAAERRTVFRIRIYCYTINSIDSFVQRHTLCCRQCYRCALPGDAVMPKLETGLSRFQGTRRKFVLGVGAIALSAPAIVRRT